MSATASGPGDAPIIVVAVDFATHADEICATATDLARRMGARVRLLHVLDLPFGLRPDTPITAPGNDGPEQARVLLERDARQHLQPLVTQIEAQGVATDICLRHGDVVGSIWDCAEDSDAIMLVVGSDLPKGAKRFFVGSFTEEVLHEARCPVLVVRTRGKTPAPGPGKLRQQVRAEIDG